MRAAQCVASENWIQHFCYEKENVGRLLWERKKKKETGSFPLMSGHVNFKTIIKSKQTKSWRGFTYNVKNHKFPFIILCCINFCAICPNNSTVPWMRWWKLWYSLRIWLWMLIKIDLVKSFLKFSFYFSFWMMGGGWGLF